MHHSDKAALRTLHELHGRVLDETMTTDNADEVVGLVRALDYIAQATFAGLTRAVEHIRAIGQDVEPLPVRVPGEALERVMGVEPSSN